MLMFAVSAIILTPATSVARDMFRSRLARDAAEYLAASELLPSADGGTAGRIEYAVALAELKKATDAALAAGRLSGDDALGRSVSILIEEFETELDILRIQNALALERRQQAVALSKVTGRLVAYAQGYYDHPFQTESGVTTLPSFHMKYASPSPEKPAGPTLSAVSGELGFKTAGGEPKRLKIDEANVTLGLFGGAASLKIGRIYFILGRLGLIADNNFDAFEGASLDVITVGDLKISGVYARMSSTNYPRTKAFESADDYWAARVSKEFADGHFEAGATALFSGIASEDGAAVDIWWRSPWRSREFVLEAAAYRPTKSGIIEDIEPYEPRWAVVGGFDAVKNRNFNVFVQLGDVAKGFTPMATSLAYSARDHLYFDHDTRGIDAAFTYFPRIKEDVGPWQSRPERTLATPKYTFYEINLVYLWDSDWRKSQTRHILRHSRPVGRDMKFYIENTIWQREETTSWPARGAYNETRIYLTLEI
ncbi:MAG: hypothetical protein QME32_03240 [Endomicrobiia bacterium]|nr:hypothetical protein [Endomicrobiia bacterium]